MKIVGGLIAITCSLLASTDASACIDLIGPQVISDPGEYCLNADINVAQDDGYGITITADHVAINLRNFAIIGSGPHNHVAGIYANGVKDLRLEGGRVTGFLFGVRIDSASSDHPASDIVIRGLDLSGNGSHGIKISAQHAVMTLNRIDGIKGSVELPSGYSFGIDVDGGDCEITQNFIRDIMPNREGEGVGISIDGSATGCVVRDNLIRQSSVKYGRTMAVWVGGQPGVPGRTIAENYMIGGDYGVLGWWNDAKSNFIRNSCDTGLHDAEYVDSNVYEQTGACNQTVSQLRAAVAKDNSDPLLHFDLARSLYELGSGEARAEFEQACELGLQEACRKRDILARPHNTLAKAGGE